MYPLPTHIARPRIAECYDPGKLGAIFNPLHKRAYGQSDPPCEDPSQGRRNTASQVAESPPYK